MKKIILLLSIFFLLPLVQASTNCLTGCDVNGGTIFGVYIDFTTWNSTNNTVTLSFKDANGTIVGSRDTLHVDQWNTPQYFDFYAKKDGNYTMEVFASGTSNTFDINFVFISNGTYSTYTDSNCAGSSCGGNTKIYRFSTSHSPAYFIDDGAKFTPAIKGGSNFRITTSFYDVFSGFPCSGPCDAQFRVRRLSDNAIVAAIIDTGSSGPYVFNYWADHDGNYSVEIFFEGKWGQYDTNIFYQDVTNAYHAYLDTYQYVGSNLSTGTAADYRFDVSGSSTVIFDDNKIFSPTMKGNALMNNSIQFSQGYSGFPCGGVGSCDYSISIQRKSDNAIVAHKYFSNWAGGPFNLKWLPDYDGEYAIEIWYQGPWGSYNLLTDYTNISNTATQYNDITQYIGSYLTTGDTTEYSFNVENSTPVLLDDNITLPFKAKKSTNLSAKIKFTDVTTLFPCSGGCDLSLKIRRVSDGNTMAQISTTNASTWISSPATLNWTVTGEDAYFIEVWNQGFWGVYDLNVDYTDTTGVSRHYEDKYQYVGSNLTTGNFTEYYFNSGPSCGNGIDCISPQCVPIDGMINGDYKDKIDLAFTGSGFPNTTKLKEAIEFVVNWEGDENGLFSFEPFKSNRDKFNVWMVNLNDTYTAASQPLNENLVMMDYPSMLFATGACPFADEFSLLSIEPRIWAHAFTQGTSGKGGNWNFMTMGCEFLGTCNYPLDIDKFVAGNPLCDGNGSGTDCDFGASGPDDHQRLFAHEFGHSFGGLLDEYVPNYSAVGGGSGNAPNCTTDSTCHDWNIAFPGIMCVQGCTYDNWYRPYEESLMSTHQIRFEYKPVNEAELENDILTYPTGQGAPNSFLTWVANVRMGPGAQVNDFTLAPGHLNNVVDFNGEYRAQLIDANGTVIYDYNFGLGNTVLFEDENTQTISSPNINIRLPFFSTGKLLVIRDQNANVVLTKDLLGAQNIEYEIGYGGSSITGLNYHVDYWITPQPVGIINSGSYVGKLGEDFS